MVPAVGEGNGACRDAPFLAEPGRPAAYTPGIAMKPGKALRRAIHWRMCG